MLLPGTKNSCLGASCASTTSPSSFCTRPSNMYRCVLPKMSRPAETSEFSDEWRSYNECNLRHESMPDIRATVSAALITSPASSSCRTLRCLSSTTSSSNARSSDGTGYEHTTEHVTTWAYLHCRLIYRNSQPMEEHQPAVQTVSQRLALGFCHCACCCQLASGTVCLPRARASSCDTY